MVRTARSGGAEGARTTPGWMDQLAYALVIFGMGGGLAWVALHHFKRGAALIAGILIVGGMLRLVLPARLAGLLASRSRAFDAVLLCLLGIGIGVVAYFVPRPS